MSMNIILVPLLNDIIVFLLSYRPLTVATTVLLLVKNYIIAYSS